MRDVADAAGVREAAIYRHFTGKEAMAKEIFASWYQWYSEQVARVVAGTDSLRKKVAALVRVEFEAARAHPQEFLFFCENEARFLRSLPRDIPRVRQELVKMLRGGQARGEVRSGDGGLLADLLSGALCAVTISAIHRKDLPSLEDGKVAAESCWQMLRKN